MAVNQPAGRGRRNGTIIAVAVVVVAVVVYFLFFTGRPDQGTRTNETLQPSAASEMPEPTTTTPTTTDVPPADTNAADPAK